MSEPAPGHLFRISLSVIFLAVLVARLGMLLIDENRAAERSRDAYERAMQSTPAVSVAPQTPVFTSVWQDHVPADEAGTPQEGHRDEWSDEQEYGVSWHDFVHTSEIRRKQGASASQPAPRHPPAASSYVTPGHDA